MMDLLKRPLRLVLSIIIILQAFFAFLFVQNQSGSIPEYRDTLIYLRLSETLTTDGWHPILYTALVRLFRDFGDKTNLAFQGWLYSFQIIVMLLSTAVLIAVIYNRLFQKKMSLTIVLAGAIAISSYPPLMQLNLCVLPYSLAISLAVIAFSLTILLYFEQTQERKLFFQRRIILTVLLCVCVFLTGILERHVFYGLFVWLVGIIVFRAVVLLCSVIGKKTEKQLLHWQISFLIILAVTLASGMISVAVNQKTPKEENLVFMPYSLLNDTTDRFVFPRLYEDYSSYPEDVQQVFTREVALICTGRYEYYQNSIGPMICLNDTVSEEHIWKEMIKVGLVNRTRELAVSSLLDGMDALFPHLAMIRMKFNNQNSFYGYHISRMWEKDAGMVRIYFGYGIIVNAIIMIFGCVFMIIELFQGCRNSREEQEADRFAEKKRLFVLTAAMILCQAFMAVLFEKMGFDYHHTGVNFMLWTALAVPAVYSAKFEKSKGI